MYTNTIIYPAFLNLQIYLKDLGNSPNKNIEEGNGTWFLHEQSINSPQECFARQASSAYD